MRERGKGRGWGREGEGMRERKGGKGIGGMMINGEEGRKRRSKGVCVCVCVCPFCVQYFVVKQHSEEVTKPYFMCSTLPKAE